MADDKKARELLEKIRRVPHNKKCCNCDADAPFGSGGHGDVCVKFGTFVCHTCKSAHQAFSHRCKSVTMSNWTTHEVLALKDEAGGGNAYARKTWLGQLEGSGLVLRPDDPLDKVKAFVDECYNRKRYWRDPEGSGSSPTTQRSHAGATPSSSGPASGVRPPTPPPASHAKQHDADFAPRGASAAGTDFLDFAADFSSPTATATTTNGNANGAAHQQDAWEPFQGAMGATSTGTGNGSAFTFIAAPPAPAPAPASASHHHDFGDFMAAAPAATPAPAPMPMQPQAPKPVMLSSARAFDDPFAGLSNPAHSAFGSGMMQRQQAQQPDPMLPMGGMCMAPMGMMMGPPRPAPGMMMGGGPMPPRPMGMGPMGMGPMGGGRGGGAPPANGIPGCGFVVPSGPGPVPRGPPPPAARPMGMGMGFAATSFASASYKPQEPDPFASLDAAWRNK